MKIVHVVPDLRYGGAEKVCIELCNYMAIQGHEVILCSLCNHDPSMRSIESVHKTVKIIFLGKKRGLNVRVFFKLKDLIDKQQPDIIHAHMVGMFYLLLTVIGRKRKIFYTVHNVAKKDAAIYYRIFYRNFFKYFKVMPVAVSNYVLNTVYRTYRLKNCLMIYNGVPVPVKTERCNLVKEEIMELGRGKISTVFICLARIHRSKRIELLLRAFDRFYCNWNEGVLLILGSVADQSYYEELLRLKAPHTFFLGAKENVYDYLCNADAICLTSLYEGLPVALVEAMALGIIPITVPLKQITEMITSEVNGILSLSDSVDDYYAALNHFYQMTQERKQMIRENALKTFTTYFNISACGSAYLIAYNS